MVPNQAQTPPDPTTPHIAALIKQPAASRSVHHPLLGRASLHLRMRLINSIFAAGIVAFTVITHLALKVQLAATDELIYLNEAEQYAQDADRLHDSLRGDLYAALLTPRMSATEAEGFAQTWQSEIARFRDDLQHQAALTLPPEVARNVNETRRRAEEFLARSEDLMELGSSEQGSIVAQLPDFEARFSKLGDTFASLNSLLSQEIRGAKTRASVARDEADRSILLAAALIIGGTILLTWTITRSIRRSVRHVSSVAHALAAGQLDVRYENATADEVGAIGTSLNAMADSLHKTMQQMHSDAAHDRFNKQLAEAFEIADSEQDIAGVVSRAMLSISGDHAMELLCADSSRSQFERAAEHPTAGAPCCKVESPAKCVAVRRGSTVVSADSEQLNACPYLRGREGGPVSAVCVPLSFMGNSLGVLHATSSVAAPLQSRRVIDLETLALLAGTRTGTVRAFQQTQTQALTDSMTGLSNRRAFESEITKSIRTASNFAVVMADLDHFKKLNDTHGHAAGDKALQLFAEVVKDAIRAGDRAARWGGEEFVIMLNGTTAAQAIEWVRRLRERLVAKIEQAGGPPFTASFGIADSSMSPDLDGLMRTADSALYVSKTEGRDRATVGSSDLAMLPDEDESHVPESVSSATV